MSSGTVKDLYETLISGSKFRLQFNSKAEARNFRSLISTHKFRSEKPLKDMGVIQHQVLSMTYDNETNIATFLLRDTDYVRSTTKFEILEIIPPCENIK